MAVNAKRTVIIYRFMSYYGINFTCVHTVHYLFCTKHIIVVFCVIRLNIVVQMDHVVLRNTNTH